MSLSDLRMFCTYIIGKYGNPNRITEEEKAEEFRSIYMKDHPLNLKTLRAVAACCGMKLDEWDEMPQNMRGYHEVNRGERNIYFKSWDTVSGIQNTILHELREIMEGTFKEVNPSYEPLPRNALHVAANRFAAAVLLPEDEFRSRAYETGLDIIELAEIYSKSCSQVLLRLGEVLKGRLFFYAALYEPHPEDGARWRVTYWTGSVNNQDPEANVYGLDGLFPRKGRKVISGSLVDMTIRAGQPHLVERATLADNMEEDGLVAIARPQMIAGIPAKVALIAMLKRDRKLLEPQIERIKPSVITEFNGHL